VAKREVAYVGFFTLAGNLLGLAFTLVTARVLSLEQYALFASTLFLFGIVGLTTGTLQSVSAFDVASQAKSEYQGLIRQDPRLLLTLKISAGISASLGIALFLLAANEIIRDEPAIRYASIAFYLPAAALVGIALGRMQGRGEMVKLTGYSFLGTLVKLLALISTKFTTATAASIAWSIAISTYIFAALALFSTRGIGAVKISALRRHTMQIGALGVLFWLGTGIDLLFLNFALSGEEAGKYGIVANICRLSLIPALYLSQKSFSRIIVAHSKNESVAKLMFSVAKTGAALVLLAATGMMLIGDRFFEIVRGESSAGYGTLAAAYLLCLAPLTVALPVLQKDLARPNNRLIYLLLVVVILGSALVVTIPETTNELLFFLGFLNVLITGIMLRNRYSVNRIIKIIGRRA
jgi:O-antigen/teichoic acid export membrane protein